MVAGGCDSYKVVISRSIRTVMPVGRAVAAAFAVAAVATALGGGGARTSAVAGAADGTPFGSAAVERIAGADRYETAAAVSRAAFGEGAPVVVLASGTSDSDALVAAPLAAAEGGPVLLVERDALPAATATELERLRPSSVLVVGGSAAVSDDVAGAAGVTERLAGGDRYETAAAIARRLHPEAGPVAAVYVASGESFPDALSGAAPAARDHAPVVLTRRDSLPDATAVELARLRPDTTVVLGGPAAVDGTLDAVIARHTGGAVGRSEGRDRWATSSAISANAYPGGGAVPVAYIASGSAFPDALAGGVLAGRTGGPILLSAASCLPARVESELERLAPGRIVVIGGTDAVGAGALGGTPCPQPHDPRPVTRDHPMTVLVLGDSMATEPYYSLERLYEWFGGTILPIKGNKPGTGLNRPDVFDWQPYAAATLAAYDPDVVTMILGANDTDEMSMADGRRVAFGSDEWRTEYLSRVDALMDIFAVDGRLVVWTSEPVMGREPLNANVSIVSDLMSEVAAEHAERGVVWLDSRPLFADESGRYVNNGWRLADEIHFTPAGGDRVIGAQLDVILTRWGR
jgi:putative cell wall-binding protein